MRKKLDVRLSPRERRLTECLIGRPDWMSSFDLTVREFGTLRQGKWPPHARTIVTNAMRSTSRKLQRNRGSFKLMKRGGGRSGTEYLLVERSK